MTATGDTVEIALEASQVDGASGVGRVIGGGEHAAGLIDRRVLVGAIDPCGECDVCRRGGAAVCPAARRRAVGGAGVTAAARWLVPLGDGLDLPVPAAAAVAGDVATAYTLYARTGAGPREPVVVVGAHPIGRFLIEILLAKGASPAALADSGPWAVWLAERGVPAAGDRAGLAAVFAAHDQGGRPWRIICADPAAISSAAALAGPRATLTVLSSAAPGSSNLASGNLGLPAELIAREVTVIGVAGPHPDLVVEAAAMCVKREIDLSAGTSLAPDALRSHVRTPGRPEDYPSDIP